MNPLLFRAIAALLDYPSHELSTDLPELRALLMSDKTLTKIGQQQLNSFFDYMLSQGDYDLQENYVALFDRGRGTSLHLFEHVHGDSRDRGQAMVDLKAMYDNHGMTLSQPELPDYLPVFLEFLSCLPSEEARDLLNDTTHIIRNIGEQIAKRGSHYYFLLSALLILAGEKPLDVAFTAHDVREEPNDLEAIDKAWEEEPVTFGGCNTTPTYDAKTHAAVVQVRPSARAAHGL